MGQHPQLILILKVQPVLGGCAKGRAELNRRRSGDSGLAIDNLADELSGPADCFGKLPCAAGRGDPDLAPSRRYQRLGVGLSDALAMPYGPDYTPLISLMTFPIFRAWTSEGNPSLSSTAPLTGPHLPGNQAWASSCWNRARPWLTRLSARHWTAPSKTSSTGTRPPSPGSILLYFAGADVVCPVQGMTPEEGKPIPNTFTG
jgi:hypothetical protein